MSVTKKMKALYALTIHEKERNIFHKGRTADDCAKIMREAQDKGHAWTIKKEGEK